MNENQTEKDDINWSKDNCICGYWVGKKWSGQEDHSEKCPNHIYDNTPDPIGLMIALRTLGLNSKTN